MSMSQLSASDSSDYDRFAVPTGSGVSLMRSLSDSATKKHSKAAKSASFYKELTDALHHKVADFMTGVSELDDEEAQAMDSIKAMLMEESRLRSVSERRLEERLNKLDISVAAFDSVHSQLHERQQMIALLHERIDTLEKDRIDALETMFGASCDKATRDIHSLKQELEVTKQAYHRRASAVEALDNAVKDLAATCASHAKAHQNQGTAMASLESAVQSLGMSADQTTKALAATHMKIAACQKDHAALKDGVDEKHSWFQDSLDRSVSEALMVAKARLDQTNTRLDQTYVSLHTCEMLCSRLQEHTRDLEVKFVCVVDSVNQTRNGLAACERYCDVLDHRCQSIEEHAHEMKKDIEQSSKKQIAEMDSLRADHNMFFHMTHQNHAVAVDVLTKAIKDLDTKTDLQVKATQEHSSLVESLQLAVKDLGITADHNAKAHQEHFSAVESLQVVKDLGILADQNVKALAVVNAKLDRTQCGLQACEKHCAVLDEHCVNLLECTHELERRLDASGEKYTSDLESIKADNSSLVCQVSLRQTELKDMIEEEAKARMRHHEVVHERLETMERRHSYGDERCDNHAVEIRSLREEHMKNAKDMGIMKSHVEMALCKLAQSTASELKIARDDVDQVLTLLVAVQRAWATKIRGSRTSRGSRLYADEVASPKRHSNSLHHAT